jgi:hypothetical protein
MNTVNQQNLAMDQDRTFKTKTGHCHVTQDKIILTRDGVAGDAAKVISGGKLYVILCIYGLLSLVLAYFAIRNYIQGSVGMALLQGALAFTLIYGIIKSRNNSGTPEIDRKDIRRVSFDAGTPGLTLPRFEVEFVDNGKVSKRLIMLPGRVSGGQQEVTKAIQIMKDEKLLS